MGLLLLDIESALVATLSAGILLFLCDSLIAIYEEIKELLLIYL